MNRAQIERIGIDLEFIMNFAYQENVPKDVAENIRLSVNDILATLHMAHLSEITIKEG
jgi:uncharacterized alkaline shock family protein YloU